MSVHFMNTVARSSVLLISADVLCIENDHNSERTEDRATVFLKWTDFGYHLRIFQHGLQSASNPRVIKWKIALS